MILPGLHNLPKSLLLAVSGGVDSLVMADIIISSGRFDVSVAHCNFSLRGSESDEDEAFVRAWAVEKGVRLFTKRFDTSAFAAATRQSIEMAARELRYCWFDTLCRENSFDGVCVAHNANDNAETLFLNLLRGTGIKGICGMEEKSRNPFGDTNVYRPLLRVSRDEIQEYARTRGIQFRTDSTNLSCEVKRNLLRNKVFPLFKEINPSFLAVLSRDMENFRQFREISEQCTAHCKDIISEESGAILLKELTCRPHWQSLLSIILSDYGFSHSVIRDVLHLLEDNRNVCDDSSKVLSGKVFSAPGYKLVTTNDRLIIEPDSQTADTPSFNMVIRPLSPDDNPRTPRGTVIMDADAAGDFVVRPWRSGDWLRPIGLGGRKKVSDMLTDLKYDVLRKKEAFVAVRKMEDSHILALLCERVDESVAVSRATRNIVIITKR